MRKSDIAKNSTISSNFLLLVATILSILLFVAPSISALSSLSPVAFASHGGDYHNERGILDVLTIGDTDNQVAEQDRDSSIGNLISQQQNPQASARNVNTDNKVIIVENCGDGEVIINDNDEIIQTNTQSFNQEANNQVTEEEDEQDED